MDNKTHMLSLHTISVWAMWLLAVWMPWLHEMHFGLLHENKFNFLVPSKMKCMGHGKLEGGFPQILPWLKALLWVKCWEQMSTVLLALQLEVGRESCGCRGRPPKSQHLFLSPSVQQLEGCVMSSEGSWPPVDNTVRGYECESVRESCCQERWGGWICLRCWWWGIWYDTRFCPIY